MAQKRPAHEVLLWKIFEKVTIMDEHCLLSDKFCIEFTQLETFVEVLSEMHIPKGKKDEVLASLERSRDICYEESTVWELLNSLLHSLK